VLGTTASPPGPVYHVKKAQAMDRSQLQTQEGTPPRMPLLEPDTRFLVKWHKGRHLDKQDVFILILSGLVLLIGILVGIAAITEDLFDGMDEDQSETRNGTGQKLAWFSETLMLTDDQRAQIRSIFKDEHSRMVGLRQDSLRSPQEKRAKFQDIRAKALNQMCSLLTGNHQTALRQIQEGTNGRDVKVLTRSCWVNSAKCNITHGMVLIVY
jgi:Spy/CpxP family protein refolding chaperone